MQSDMKRLPSSLPTAVKLVLSRECTESLTGFSSLGFHTYFCWWISLHPGVGIQQVLHPTRWASWLTIVAPLSQREATSPEHRITLTDLPSESLVEPSLPMIRYWLSTSSSSLQWRLIANTRTEFSPTWVSPSVWHSWELLQDVQM